MLFCYPAYPGFSPFKSWPVSPPPPICGGGVPYHEGTLVGGESQHCREEGWNGTRGPLTGVGIAPGEGEQVISELTSCRTSSRFQISWWDKSLDFITATIML